MRFMVTLRSNEFTESAQPPDTATMAAMIAYHEELVKAGVLLAAEGLHPSDHGARIHFSGDKRTVVDGPFAETKELIAGFWLFQVRSKEEAIEWIKRCPNPTDGESVIEIRQVFEADDVGESLTPELRARVAVMDEQAAW